MFLASLDSADFPSDSGDLVGSRSGVAHSLLHNNIFWVLHYEGKDGLLWPLKIKSIIISHSGHSRYMLPLRESGNRQPRDHIPLNHSWPPR